MTPSMAFDRYLSHPGDGPGAAPVLLSDHLRSVARITDEELPTGVTTAAGTPLRTLGTLIGLTHDLGKLTTWCQRYLRGRQTHAPEPYQRHWFPSALVTQYCAATHPEIPLQDAVLSAMVVARHHKLHAPPDPESMQSRYGSDRGGTQSTYDRVERQLQNIGDVAPATQVADAILAQLPGTSTERTWADFLSWYDRQQIIETLSRQLAERNRGAGYYPDLIRLWGTLKFADHVAASLGTDLPGVGDSEAPFDWNGLPAVTDASDPIPSDAPATLDAATVGRHVRETFPDRGGIEGELDGLRTQARQQAVKSVDDLLDNPAAIGEISLPTGFGKTYAGLAAGLHATAKTGGRLVYVLPYTSILDQTAAEIRTVFGVDETDVVFSLHHHLATTLTDLGDAHTDADIGRSPGALHAESWRSQLTLTTTVQLFESLAAPAARQATKLPALQNAVVVLDEPQAIPERWWQLVPELLKLLVERFDATIIQMTATQPRFVDHSEPTLPTMSLVGGDDDDQYTQFLHEHPRVQYDLDSSISGPNSVTYETAAGRLIEALGGGAHDTLAICNTRLSAQTLYREVRDRAAADSTTPIELGRQLHRLVEREGAVPDIDTLRETATTAAETDGAGSPTPILVYLSGDLRPDDRRCLIDALYGDAGTTESLLESPYPVLLVSTTLVEVGVDLSFDRVFRDIAPIPNLVQAGGRCNRAFGGKVGRVVVWNLAATSGTMRRPSQLIYGGNDGETLPLLYATRAVLSDAVGETVSETRMIDSFVEAFYHRINTQFDPGDAGLVDALRECDVETLAEARMIEETTGYQDIIACATDEERRVGGFESSDCDETALLEATGAQLSADPPADSVEVSIGNAPYYLVDARSDRYHPVLGLI